MKKLIIACSCTLLFSLSAMASIVGDNFTIEYDFPSLGTVYAITNVTVNPTGFWHNPVPGVSGVSITDGTISITNTSTGWTGRAFDGFVFTDTSEVPNFSSFTLVSVTGNPPPMAPALSFDASDLIVNFTPGGANNVNPVPGSVYTFAFTTAPVPEPSMISLACLGALALASRLRRSERL